MREHVEEIHRLGARRVGVFGSFARGDAADDSDVDAYVEFDDAKRTYDNFFALHELLETSMGRQRKPALSRRAAEGAEKKLFSSFLSASSAALREFFHSEHFQTAGSLYVQVGARVKNLVLHPLGARVQI